MSWWKHREHLSQSVWIRAVIGGSCLRHVVLQCMSVMSLLCSVPQCNYHLLCSSQKCEMMSVTEWHRAQWVLWLTALHTPALWYFHALQMLSRLTCSEHSRSHWYIKHLIWLSCWLLGCVTEALSQQQDTGCNRKHWGGAVVSSLQTHPGRCWSLGSSLKHSVSDRKRRCLTAARRGNHVTHEHVFLTVGLNNQQRGLVYDPGNTDLWGSPPKHAAQTVFHQREKPVWVTFVLLEQQMEQNVLKDGGL